MTKALVISDSHLRPGYECYELWAALGHYCVEHKPEFIIHLGDAVDLQSQQWLKKDRGTSTLAEEIECLRLHLSAFHGIINDYNAQQRKTKHKQYRPELIFCAGNHDVRNDITDVMDVFDAFGWLTYDYLEPADIGKWTFCHAMRKGLSDQMCTTAQELVENWHSNIVVGHGHHKDFFESYSMATAEPIIGMRCPVFTPYHTGDWCMQTRNKWSRGFTEIDLDTREFVWRDLRCLLKNSSAI